MKITKDNYNELRKKELDNNFAKVWHVNEIREELLNATPEVGFYTIPAGEGDIEITTLKGLVTLEHTLIPGESLFMNLSNSNITSSSLIIVTVFTNQPTVQSFIATSGNMGLRILNKGTDDAISISYSYLIL